MNSTALPQNMTVSQARDNLYDLIEEAGSNSRRFVISHHGRPTAVVLSVDELEGLEETIDIMSNSKLMKDINQAKKDRNEGRVYTLEEVVKDLGLDENRIYGKGKKTAPKAPFRGGKKGNTKDSIARNFSIAG